jgi:hypothetical protein
VPPLSHLTCYTPIKSNLYLGNSLANVVSEPDLYRLHTFHVPKLISLFHCTGLTKGSVLVQGTCIVHKKASFYGELLAPCPNPKLEDRHLLALCNCLCNIFVATLCNGGRSFVCNVSTHRAMMTVTHLSWDMQRINTLQNHDLLITYDHLLHIIQG